MEALLENFGLFFLLFLSFIFSKRLLNRMEVAVTAAKTSCSVLSLGVIAEMAPPRDLLRSNLVGGAHVGARLTGSQRGPP